jgi:hypothetical protein
LALSRENPHSRRYETDAEERIVVRGWDAADVNWQEGTVRGLRDGERWPIEAYRFRLEHWADIETAMVKGRARAAERQRAGGAIRNSYASTEETKGSGGRTPKYDWFPVGVRLGAWLCDNGAPKSGDGGQAQLEKLVSSMFPEHSPSESIIREKVSQAIVVYRKERGR